MSALTDKAIVKKELLYDVAGRDRYHVNNKHDDKYSPLPPNKIVQRAEELVGQEVPYKLTSENCEHFVNELRYGVSRSDQVRLQPVSWSPGAIPFAQLTVAGRPCGRAGVETEARMRQNSRDRISALEGVRGGDKGGTDLQIGSVALRWPLTPAPRGRFYHPQITDVETEAHSASVTC